MHALICTNYANPKVGVGCGSATSPELCRVGRGNPTLYRDGPSRYFNNRVGKIPTLLKDQFEVNLCNYGSKEIKEENK